MEQASVLKEFLIAIGFDIDAQQEKRFNEFVDKVASTLKTMALEGAEAALVLAGEITNLADQMEQLYFVAQRTGSSAGGIRAFQFGAAQVGVSAEQATAALEGFAQVLRTQPGTGGLLKAWGIDVDHQDKLKSFMQMLDVLRRMPPYMAAKYGSMFGIDYRTLTQLMTNYDQLKGSEGDELRRAKALGLTVEQYKKLTEQSHAFMNRLRGLERTWGDVALVMLGKFLPTANRVLDFLDKTSGWLVKLNQLTHGWSSALLGVVAALGAVGVAGGALRLIGMGLGIAGGGAGAAGGAAAAASVGSVLAVVLASVGVIVAAVVGVYELHKHKDQVEAFGRNLLQGLPSLAGTGTFNSVADLLKHFEGHAKGGYGEYKDEAGIPTIGFGHRIKPGEHFSSNFGVGDATNLLMDDIAQAAKVVRQHVHRAITSNQQEALTSLEFNIGEQAFANSTLLKKLNAGDDAGAAAEFERWSKFHKGSALVSSSALAQRRMQEAGMFRGDEAPGNIALHQSTTIHVTGGQDTAKEVAAQVVREQHRVNGDAVRNLAGVVQ